MTQAQQDTEELLTGKVAQILNERELVINIGRNQGVEEGMRFAVLAGKPIEIYDPDTHSLIGELDRPKVRVEATSVHGNIAVCRTYVTRTVGGGLFTSIPATLLGPTTVVESLRSDDADRPQPLTEEESIVKIGDRVSQLPISEQ